MAMEIQDVVFPHLVELLLVYGKLWGAVGMRHEGLPGINGLMRMRGEKKIWCKRRSETCGTWYFRLHFDGSVVAHREANLVGSDCIKLCSIATVSNAKLAVVKGLTS